MRIVSLNWQLLVNCDDDSLKGNWHMPKFQITISSLKWQLLVQTEKLLVQNDNC